MAKELNVKVVVGLVDRLSAPLRGLARDIERTTAMTANMTFVGDALSRTGQQMVTPLQEMVREAQSFEASVADVQKVLDGLERPAALAAYRDDLLAASEQMPLAKEQLAALDAQAARMGKTLADLPTFRRMTAMQAVSFDMDPAAVAEQMGILANLYGWTDRQALHFADTLSALDNAMTTNERALLDIVNRTQSVAKGFGLTDVQTAALAASFNSVGLAEERASTAMNALLNTLLTAGSAPQRVAEGLAQIGLSAQQVEAAVSADPTRFLDDFMTRVGELDNIARANVLTNVFGREFQDEIGALSGAADLYRTAMQTIAGEDVAGTMERAYGLQLGTLENQAQLLANARDNLETALGETLIPTLKDLVAWLGEVIRPMRAWAKENPALAGAVLKTTAAVGALMLIGGGVVTALAGIVGGVAMLSVSLKALGLAPLAASLRAVGGVAAGAARGVRGMAMALMLVQGGPLAKVLFVVRAIGAALLATPVGWLVAALAGAALLIRKYWAPISGFFRGLWDGITAGLAPLAPAFASAWGAVAPVLQPVLDALGAVWDWLTRLLEPVRGTGAAAEEMGRRWGAAIAAMIAKVGELLRVLLALPGKVIGIGRDLIDGLWQGISERWAALKARVAGIADSIAGIFRRETETRSPSRVFARLGGDLIAGLSLGIEQRMGEPLARMRTLAGALAGSAGAALLAGAPAAAMPTPMAQAARLVEQVQGPVQVVTAALPTPTERPASARPVRVDMPVTITIHAAPGQDPRDIAEQVRAELDRAGRRVATLYDGSDDL